MNGYKGALLSTGIWGGAAAAVPALDQLLVFLRVLPFPFLGDVLSIVLGAGGALLSIFGRVKAEKKIKGLI